MRHRNIESLGQACLQRGSLCCGGIWRKPYMSKSGANCECRMAKAIHEQERSLPVESNIFIDESG